MTIDPIQQLLTLGASVEIQPNMVTGDLLVLVVYRGEDTVFRCTRDTLADHLAGMVKAIKEGK